MCPDVVVAEGYSSVDHGTDPQLQVKLEMIFKFVHVGCLQWQSVGNVVIRHI